MDERWLLAGKREKLQSRARMLQVIREFFLQHDFLEVETPYLTPAPAPEPYIEAVPCGQLFLQTSPELYMKRLLASGYPRLFQLCRCFRQGERGAYHLPEFTMLEWYRREADYRQLMDDCEALLMAVAAALGCGTALRCGGQTISLQPPWERLSVTDAFARFSPLPLAQAVAQDRFEELLVDYVEPQLSADRPVFLFDFPLLPGSLARPTSADGSLVERCELYIAGLEVANGFSELADAEEQRRRFAAAAVERMQAGRAEYPVAERFLAALGAMGPAAGIALGIDRLTMVFTGASHIDEVVAFPPEIC